MEHPSGESEADRTLPELAPDVARWQESNGAGSDAEIVALPARRLSDGDFGRPRRRRVFLPVFLFIATCLSTFIAGSLDWDPGRFMATGTVGQKIAQNWSQGLIYAGAVIGILLTHEMGHFIQTVRYGVPASLPFFIPVPFLLTGTMGAVIGMEGSRADRKQLFDIGISGPWAGLIVALPIIWFGVKDATIMKSGSPIVLGDPLIFKLMAYCLKPGISPDMILDKNNPLLMAGWVGMLITGLNMMPISQLDGGHVIYGLFGQRAKIVARAFMIAAILFIVLGEHYTWTMMLVLVIMLGVDHPPTRDDNVELGWPRRIFGLVSLAIPVLCFAPVQFT
jgi:membrane-associated protease RseP (regulator of RpoE activity)